MGNFRDCSGYSKALAIFAAAIAAVSLRRSLQRDYSIANNVMQ